jgi:hypothetical protein
MERSLKFLERRRILLIFMLFSDELCDNQRELLFMTLQVFLYTDFDYPFEIFKLF